MFFRRVLRIGAALAVIAAWRVGPAAAANSASSECVAVYKAADTLAREVLVFTNNIHMAAGLRASQEAQMTRDKASAKRLNEIADTSLATINAAKTKFARSISELADALNAVCPPP